MENKFRSFGIVASVAMIMCGQPLAATLRIPKDGDPNNPKYRAETFCAILEFIDRQSLEIRAERQGSKFGTEKEDAVKAATSNRLRQELSKDFAIDSVGFEWWVIRRDHFGSKADPETIKSLLSKDSISDLKRCYSGFFFGEKYIPRSKDIIDWPARIAMRKAKAAIPED